MNIAEILLVFVLFVSSLSAQNVWTPEQQVKTKLPGSVQVSPDGKRVVFTINEAVMTDERSEFVTQIWLADSDGTNVSQLTSGDKSSTNPKFSPDGGAIAFTSNRKNNKNNIYLLRLPGGETEQLTDLKGSIIDFEFSPDSRWIAFTMQDAKTNEEEKNDKARSDFRWVDENPKLTRLYVMPFEKDAAGKREIRKLTTENYGLVVPFTGVSWSPDSKTIAFTRIRGTRLNDWKTADAAAVDVMSGRVTLLADSPAAEMSPLFAPDGKSVAVMVSENNPKLPFSAQITIFPLAGGAPKVISPFLDESTVGLIGWAADGKRIYYSGAKGTMTRIYALDVANNSVSEINSGNEVLQGVTLSQNGRYFGFVRQTSETAPEAFISPVDRYSPVQISRVNAEMSKMPVGKTEVIRWKSTDGREIEGLLTYPLGYRAGQKFPLILNVHGGPAQVFQQTFIGGRGTLPLATLAARGFAVLRPNPRGSSGYGKQFMRANVKDWGIGDYQDLMTGVDKIIEMGVADPQRLGVMGWSYGGYMTAWVVTQTKRFKAASAGAPMTNAMSMAAMSDLPGIGSDYLGGNFWDITDVYTRHSPIFHVKGVSTPTLLIHGEADQRVPVGQSYEFFYALKTRGVPTRLLVLPRQPHGLSEPKMQVAAMQANLDWFDKYLGIGSAAENRISDK